MGLISFGKKIVTGIKTAAHATGNAITSTIHKVNS